jgi:hypothetical protein
MNVITGNGGLSQALINVKNATISWGNSFLNVVSVIFKLVAGARGIDSEGWKYSTRSKRNNVELGNMISRDPHIS